MGEHTGQHCLWSAGSWKGPFMVAELLPQAKYQGLLPGLVSGFSSAS